MTMPRPAAIFAGVSSAAVLTAVVAAVAFLGTPGEVRSQRLDKQRVNDLQSISQAINHHRRTHKLLPDTLHELRRPGATVAVRITDPVTNAPYEYRVADTSVYELCAVFAADTAESTEDRSTAAFWKHGSGRQCFRVTADPLPR